jgi:low temperature requirement protein LtrA
MRIAVSRSPNAERVVTPLELFFDLVYVFAIGQLSHHLLEHIDLRTGAETAILALAVFYAWYMTAWGRTCWSRTGCRCSCYLSG